MAGAVSAGAYSAGVFDFLIQALEEWEIAKAAERPRPKSERSVPDHKVVIPVLSGASAGGMTAALGLLAVAAGADLPKPGTAQTTGVLPPLRSAWVTGISFLPRDADARGYLLNDGDLRNGRLKSLLDSTVIDEVARKLVTESHSATPPRPYFASDLHLFLSLTNLRGIPYRIAFHSGSHDGHVMTVHGDRMHYCFKGFGSQKFDSKWLRQYQDEGKAVTPRILSDQEFRTDFLNSVLATGAFPIGLPARQIPRQTSDYRYRAWPYAGKKDLLNLKPVWPIPADGEYPYPADYAASDGGLIDNEPFEIAHWTIEAEPGYPNPTAATRADRAVLMIDPFPSPTSFDPNLRGRELVEQVWLRAVISTLIPTLKDQARVKAIELARASNVDVYSRFLIAPSRRIRKGRSRRRARDPLASGVLGAFGGFLHQRFRDHDYQLGRANCQRFLRRFLVVAADNEVVKDWSNVAKRNPKFAFSWRKTSFRTLIPLVGTADVDVELPIWPRIDDAIIDDFVSHVRSRGNAVVRKIAREELGFIAGVAARGLWCSEQPKILNKIRLMLLADLIRRDQHSKWEVLPDDASRHIIAALFEPGFDASTAPSIVRQINRTVRSVADLHVTEHEVRTLLEGPLAEYVVRFDYQVGHRRFAAYRLRNNIRRASLFGLWPNRPFFRIKVAGATSPD